MFAVAIRFGSLQGLEVPDAVAPILTALVIGLIATWMIGMLVLFATAQSRVKWLGRGLLGIALVSWASYYDAFRLLMPCHDLWWWVC